MPILDPILHFFIKVLLRLTMRFLFVKISIILILILFGSQYGWCFDTFPEESQSPKPPTTIEDGLKLLPPKFITRVATLLHMNTSRKSEMDLVRGIIAKAQDLSTPSPPMPSVAPTEAPSATSDFWSYPSAANSLRDIFGTTTNLTRSDLCEMLMGDFKADIIIVPAIRADEVSFIGGAVANFIGSKVGIVVIMVSLVLNGALVIWLAASMVCCLTNRKKKNSLKRNIRDSAPSSRYSTIRRQRRREPMFTDNTKPEPLDCVTWIKKIFRCHDSRSETESDTMEISAPRAQILDSSDDQRLGVEMANVAVRDPSPPSPSPVAPPRNIPQLTNEPYANMTFINRGLLTTPKVSPPSPPPPNPFGREANDQTKSK